MKKLFFIAFFFVYCFNFSIIAQTFSSIYSSAMMEFNNKNYGVALNLFDSLRKNEFVDEKTVSTAIYFSGICLEKLHNFEGAISRYEELTQRFPESQFCEKSYFQLGQIYFHHQRYRSSRKAFNKLIDLYPYSENSGSAFYFMGKSYFEESKYYDGEEYFAEAVSRKRTNKYIDKSIYTLGLLYEKIDLYEEAVKQYDNLLAYYSSSDLAPMTQLRIGICYFNLGKYDNVIIELSDPLIDLLDDKYKLEAQFVMASAYYKLKEYNSAVDIYNKLLDNESDESKHRQIKYGLAWVNFQLKNYSDAFNIFDDLAQDGVDTLSSSALFWSAECQRYSNNNDAAIDIYKKYFNKYPNGAKVNIAKQNIASIYFSQNKIASAERILLSLANEKNYPKQAQVYLLLGDILLRKGEYEDALKYYDISSRNTQKDYTIANQADLGLAIANYYLNNFNKSIEILNNLRSEYSNFEKDKVNFYLAEAKFASGDFAGAINNYENVSISNNNYIEPVLFGKASAYFNNGDYINSAFYFNQYVAKYPKSSQILQAKLRLADSYYATKEFSKASRIYSQLFTGNNKLNSDYAHYQFGQALYKSGKSSTAIKEFRRLQQIYPNSKFADDSQYLIAWINFQEGNYLDAIEQYKLLFEKYPESSLKPIVYNEIGNSYYNLANYENAITNYARVINDYPNTSYVFDAVSGVQFCYLAKEQPDNAVSFIDQFVTNHPNSKYADQILMKKGEMYYTNANYEKAILSYKNMIDFYPQSQLVVEANYWIGKSYFNIGDTLNAISAYKNSILKNIASDYGIASVLELGKLYTAKKQYNKAIDLYQKLESKIPTSSKLAEIVYNKALVYIAAGDYAESFNTFNQVIRYYPESIFSAKSKIEMGMMELARESYENAEILFKDLGENRKDDIGAQAQYNLGVVYYNQNRYQDAISAFVRVRSVFASYNEWYYRSLIKLGDCYTKLKDIKSAKNMYRAVIKKHKNDELGKEAARKLKKL